MNPAEKIALTIARSMAERGESDPAEVERVDREAEAEARANR